ncbi:hypothetical protein [Acidithiobacillus thiooxidans]|nr:hypothetical protein [Acidithiobacillus thiooxidans]
MPENTHTPDLTIALEYYVPAEQVVKSAETGDALQPGSLMSTKA